MPTVSKKTICARLLLGGLAFLAAGLGTGRAEPERCGAKVLLTDPSANLQDAAVAPGAATAVGASARVSVAAEPGASKPPLAVWENGLGQFRKAVSGASPVPPGAVRLYVLAALGENDELRAFDEALSEEFSDAPKPSFLPGGEGQPAPGRRKRKPRGVDDDVKPHRPSSLPSGSRRTAESSAAEPSAKPEGAPAAEVLSCSFEFSGSSGEEASR